MLREVGYAVLCVAAIGLLVAVKTYEGARDVYRVATG
jgi:hypothetical protein